MKAKDDVKEMEDRMAKIDQEIAELYRPIRLLEKRKRELERLIAIKKGRVDVNLADLKTADGLPFKEIPRKNMEKIEDVDDHRYFSYAEAGIPIARAAVPSSEKSAKITSKEMAYHCHFCGFWVKGEPNESSYDSLGMLAGSRGTMFHCSFCGEYVGEHAIMHSQDR